MCVARVQALASDAKAEMPELASTAEWAQRNDAKIGALIDRALSPSSVAPSAATASEQRPAELFDEAERRVALTRAAQLRIFAADALHAEQHDAWQERLEAKLAWGAS